MTDAVTIAEAVGAADLAQIRRLFLAYGESFSFGVCFQDFSQELATLPGDYAPPRGALWLAWRAGEAVACVALRPLDRQICEMKRLYVMPAARGHGLGRRLARHCLAEARQRGYRAIRLDTMRDEMPVAARLYTDLGFHETAPYDDNPIPGIAYYTRDLTTLPPRL